MHRGTLDGSLLLLCAYGLWACGADDAPSVGAGDVTVADGGSELPAVGGASPERGGDIPAGSGSGGASSGAGETDPEGQGGSPPLVAAPAPAAPSLPGSAAFAEGQVLEVRLTIAAADLIELDEHGDAEQYFPAAVQ